jgi:uncharacterized protein
LRKRPIYLLLTVVFVCALFCTVAGITIAESTIRPSHHPISRAEEVSAQAWAKEDGAVLSDVETVAADGVRLRGWELTPEDANGDTVLLLHGRGGSRLEMENYADLLVTHGYSVLMPDARAHGSSGGDLATFGLLERTDIHSWVDYLVATQHPQCVFGFGESMGAAQLLQSLQTESRFCAVAAECPFSTFRETAYEHLGRRFGVGDRLGRTLLRPIVDIGFLYAHLRYGIDMDQVSPEAAIMTTRTPILLIHGESDINIPIQHSRRMAARNPSIVLWAVPNTGHSSAIDTSPQELEARLNQWFGDHRGKSSAEPSDVNRTVP